MRRVLTTGASKGIGLALGQLLTVDRWRVVGIDAAGPPFPRDLIACDLTDASRAAAPVAFLLPEAARFVTGQVMHVDGGGSLGGR